MPSCKDEGECMMEDGHCVRNLHAEVDAILRASRLGFTLHGADMYSINKPCYNCTLHIIDSGIDRIFYAYAVYDEDRTTRALDVARIECIHVPVD
jgi:dCMP deaminase